MTYSMLEEKFLKISDELYDVIDAVLPVAKGTKEDVLFEAMRYSTLSRGKRLRPFLLVETAGLFGVSKKSALYTAAAIEFVHSYSLIHDDLPAIDNDDYRRGIPSCHKKFDEATAILAGDALLTFAFELLADELVHYDVGVRIALIKHIAKASGYNGMIGGQMMDVVCEKQDISFAEIIRLQRMKTGALFAVSCEAGSILGKASRNLKHALRAYANNIGLAFQITDDLLDAEGTREETGKDVNKDTVLGKATLVACMGVEEARQHAQILATQAVEHLAVFDSNADLLRSLAMYIIDRTS